MRSALFGVIFLTLILPLAKIRADSPPPCVIKALQSMLFNLKRTFEWEPQMALEAMNQRQLNRYLKANNLEWDKGADRTDPQHRTILYGYLFSRFSKYQNPKLVERMRERTLGRALEAHGINLDRGISAGQNLRQLSTRNVAELNSRFSYRVGSVLEMAEAESILNNVELIFNHNTKYLKKEPVLPILSSRQLEAMRISGGLNTHPFNKEFLKTDDNIYFFVDPSFKGNPRLSASRYGSRGVRVNSSFAKDHGYLSAFVMYPWELLQVAQVRYPQFYQRALMELTERFPPTDPLYGENWFAHGSTKSDVETFLQRMGRGDSGILDKHIAESKSFSEIRKHLHEMDFTAGDFEGLIRHRMLYQLNAMRQEDPVRFRSMISALQSADTGALDDLYRTSLRSMGLPDSFEAKIPVAVPPSELTYF